MDAIIGTITDISRFIFIGIVLYTLFRLVDNAMAEYAFRREAIGGSPGRYFGYLTIIKAPREEMLGLRYGLKWENSLGSADKCDVAIPVKKIGKRHGVLYLNRDFAVVNPIGHNRIYINGELAQRGDEVYDGDILTLGGVYLRVRLEMGGNH
ncbi:FHA domain-containing protein [Christensenella sp. MSJ-20]|uniref:FHA domain-containing protein n=1 Tax=Christensenella sp. MSJ-20 TaxID=2841518 RepID=UPI000D79147B|nr:MAG: hypothetical protein DBY42_04475 [Bacillota bacterium]QWT55211.1 FHA domain-containing protein [Christensenella sp. MSJ-20]